MGWDVGVDKNVGVDYVGNAEFGNNVRFVVVCKELNKQTLFSRDHDQSSQSLHATGGQAIGLRGACAWWAWGAMSPWSLNRFSHVGREVTGLSVQSLL